MESILRLTALKLFAAVFLLNTVGSLCVADTNAEINASVRHFAVNEASSKPLPISDFGFSPLDVCFLLRYAACSSGRSLQKSDAEFILVDGGTCGGREIFDLSHRDRRPSWQFNVVRRHLIFCRLRN